MLELAFHDYQIVTIGDYKNHSNIASAGFNQIVVSVAIVNPPKFCCRIEVQCFLYLIFRLQRLQSRNELEHGQGFTCTFHVVTIKANNISLV